MNPRQDESVQVPLEPPSAPLQLPEVHPGTVGGVEHPLDAALDFPARTEAELDSKTGRMPADADAFWVLKTIIEDGGLKLGFSLRNDKTTIYGGRPAVCFTEMPLYSLAVYARERVTTRCTPYGVAVTKLELYRAGGRQVIYGLSEDRAAVIEDRHAVRARDR
jgi:hypothetical protein